MGIQLIMKGKLDQGPQRAEINNESQQINDYIVNSAMQLFDCPYQDSFVFFLKLFTKNPSTIVPAYGAGDKICT